MDKGRGAPLGTVVSGTARRGKTRSLKKVTILGANRTRGPLTKKTRRKRRMAMKARDRRREGRWRKGRRPRGRRDRAEETQAATQKTLGATKTRIMAIAKEEKEEVRAEEDREEEKEEAVKTHGEMEEEERKATRAEEKAVGRAKERMGTEERVEEGEVEEGEVENRAETWLAAKTIRWTVGGVR